jgi:16S rRNA (cytidine1402-2'-O)-methyltransferase
VTGTLYVVATPLGNLDDLSPRAVETLRRVALIACEDTRRTGKLLARFAIATPTVSCHEFNEKARLEPILAQLRAGRDVAVVSDGGTPAISDPGALLVRSARDEGYRVAPVPGPSAAIAILSVSGFAADRFVFEGFLPARAGERRRRLRELADETRTLVFYEAPHRVRETLADFAALFGERRIVLGRELTKLHETILAGDASALLAAIGAAEVKGEIALALAGRDELAPPRSSGDTEATIVEAWRGALASAAGDRREALKRAAKALGLKKADLQRRLAELREV